MPVTWTLVADRSKAEIYESVVPPQIALIEEIDHAEGRLKDSELVTDAYGRESGSGAHRGDAQQPRELPHEHEASVFAKMLARRLSEARVRGAFDELFIVAEPQFLGRLRSELDASTEKLVVAEISKRLIGSPPEEIRDLINQNREQGMPRS